MSQKEDLFLVRTRSIPVGLTRSKSHNEFPTVNLQGLHTISRYPSLSNTFPKYPQTQIPSHTFGNSVTLLATLSFLFSPLFCSSLDSPQFLFPCLLCKCMLSARPYVPWLCFCNCRSDPQSWVSLNIHFDATATQQFKNAKKSWSILVFMSILSDHPLSLACPRNGTTPSPFYKNLKSCIVQSILQSCIVDCLVTTMIPHRFHR